MSRHLLFDLETIVKPELAASLATAFEVEVDDACGPIPIKKETVDGVKSHIEAFHPGIEWCRQHSLEEMDGKNRKGVKEALSSRISALENPIPTKWLVTPELQDIITIGTGDMEGLTEVWQFNPDESDHEEWITNALEEFWELYQSSPVLTCFNGTGFDIPILMMESKKRGITHPTFKIHSFTGMEHNLLDVMRARYGRDYRGLRASALAAGLPIEVDQEDTLVSGSNVAKAFEDGDYDLIETHCYVDIARLRQCCKAYDGIFFNL